MENLKMHSVDKTSENVAKIAALFPNCVTEARGADGKLTQKVDFEMLRQELSSVLLEGREERYTFTWPDKRQAVLTANLPVNKTLRPLREESVNFDETQNLYIEGDNLEVLKLLQETYLGKVKMIYIDPPYNTGNDFVYEDDFKVSCEQWAVDSGYYDEDGNLLVDRMRLNSESNGRFHTDWLNMIYPRLKLARDLLSDDGVIFISIDDNEQANLKKVCDEVFGAGNFVANFVRKSGISPRLDAKYISVENDLIYCYAKNISLLSLNRMKMENDASYSLSDNHEKERGKYKLNKLDRGSISYSESMDYAIIAPDNSAIYPGGTKEYNGWCWRWSKEKVEWGLKNDFIVIKKGNNGQWSVYFKQYQFVDNTNNKIKRTIPYKNLLIGFFNENATKEINDLFGANYFDYPKPVSLLKHLLQIATNKDSLILDFFSGSATTAHAVMQLNAEDGGKRKFILVQLPEICDEKSEAFKAGYKNICEIGKERIRRAGRKILEQLESESKKDGLLEANLEKPNLDVGFRVLKCDSSNMEDVFYKPEELARLKKEKLFQDNIKSDRTGEDLLFHVMLELGIMLSSKIEKRQICGKDVFYVESGYLVACFDDGVTEELITHIAKEKPFYFVMRDSSAESDSVITNFEQIFKTFSQTTKTRIL